MALIPSLSIDSLVSTSDSFMRKVMNDSARAAEAELYKGLKEAERLSAEKKRDDKTIEEANAQQGAANKVTEAVTTAAVSTALDNSPALQKLLEALGLGGGLN